MQRHSRYLQLLGILIAIGLSACSDNTGNFTPQPDPPLIEITEVSDPTPNIGDTVTIRWRLLQDNDPNSTRRVENQVVQFHSLTFDGSIFSETQGCLPEELLGGQPAQPCLPIENRDVEIRFNGPVMFDILVFDQNGRSEERLVKLVLPGQSFRVSGDTAGFLNLATTTAPTVNLPRIGSQGSSFGETEFERAFGIFETGDEDGVIDQLANDPILSQLFGDSPFLLSMTPNLDEQPGPLPFFISNRGRNFPILDSSFLFRTPEGGQFQNVRTHADAVLFAGTLSASGTVELLEGRNGTAEVITPSFRSFEPVFLQIDIRSNDQDPQQFFISDVHFGNVSQRLVFSTFRDHVSLVPPTRGEIDLAINTSQVPLLTTGSVKGAVTGFNVNLSNGDSYTPAQAMITATWSNIPIFEDTNITGLRNTYIRFTP